MKSLAKIAAWLALPLLALTAASLAFLAGTRLWGHPAIPVHTYPWQWLLYLKLFGRNGMATIWLIIGGMIAAIVLFQGGRLLSGAGGKKHNLHGASSFLERAGAYVAGFRFSLRPRPDAIVLGVWLWWGLRWYVSLPGEEHASLYARTRSGKGVSFVNPNAISWGGSLLAFSIKRDIVQETAAARHALGDRVFIFDITEPDDRTHRWNPLGLVRRGTPDAHSDIQRVMHGLVPKTKAQNPYWDNAARRIAVAAALLISETPGAVLNVNEVRKLIARADYTTWIPAMISEARVQGRPYPQAPADTLLTWLARQAEEGASSVRETLATALELWENPRVQAATECSDFDISRIRSQPMSIFVCAQPGDLRWLQLIYGIFFDQFVSANTKIEFGKDPTHINRVLVELDEFWALGKRDTLADAAAFTASFGFRICYILQSKSQVRDIFGPEGAKNLFLNTGVECLFGGTDHDTAKETAERMGTDTVVERTKSKPVFMAWLNLSRQSQNEHIHGRPLMLPQEITRLDPGQMVVLRPGHMPLKLQRIVHHKDPYYRNLVAEKLPPAPRPPPLRIRVEYDSGIRAPAAAPQAWAALP